jgi:predicted molibdopterin-dependent oxidoreductase YjgC
MADGVADRLAARCEPAIIVSVNGRPVSAFAGATVAAVLSAEGIRVFRHTAKRGEPRGVFCGMGICYECLVTVDGVPNVRACVTAVEPGMVIQTGRSEPQHG